MPRSFSEKEVGEVIQRATQLHEERAGKSDANLSLDELQRIGAELGLPADLVRAAAREVKAQTHSAQVEGPALSVTGAPFITQLVHVLDGSVSMQEWGLIVADLQRETGSTGSTREIGDTYSWERSTADMGLVLEKIHVSLESGADETTIEVRKHFGGQAFLTYMLAGAVGFTLTGIAVDGAGFEFATNLALVGTGAAGGLGVARASLGIWARRHRQRLSRLVERVQRRVAVKPSDAGGEVGHSTGVQAQPVIDLPGPDEHEGDSLSGHKEGPIRDGR